MNTAQRKIVRGWVIAALIIFIALLNGSWVMENWDIIKFPMFIVILIIATFSGNKPKYGQLEEGRSNISRMVEENSWLKIYYAVYVFLIILALVYIVINKVKLTADPSLLFIPILLVIFPIIIVQQKEAYRNASKKI